MNRFDDLKANRGGKLSAEEFIRGASKDGSARKARKKVAKEKILLSITGRIASIDEYTKKTHLHIRRDVQEDIEKYCLGNMQGILNYLLRRGLDDLIASKELVMEQLG